MSTIDLTVEVRTDELTANIVDVMSREQIKKLITDLDFYMADEGFTRQLIKDLQDSLEDETPLKGRWIRWDGGECPVERGTLLNVRYRDGRINYNVRADMLERELQRDASKSFWSHDGMTADIVAFQFSEDEE